MQTNVKVSLTDDDRNRLAILFDGGKQSKRMATRKEVVSFVNACLDRALEAHPHRIERHPGPAETGERVSEVVLHDINEGGWSLIDE